MNALFRPAPLALTIAAALTAGCANTPSSAQNTQPATRGQRG